MAANITQKKNLSFITKSHFSENAGGNNIEFLIYWDLKQGAKIVHSVDYQKRMSAQMTWVSTVSTACTLVASSGLNVLLLSSKCWGNFGSLWEIKCLETIKCLVFTCDFEKGSALHSTGGAHKATKERAEDRTCAKEKECSNQRLRCKATKAVTTYNKCRCLWVRTTCTCGMEIKSCCVWCGQWKCTEERCRAQRKRQNTEQFVKLKRTGSAMQTDQKIDLFPM